MKKRFTDDDFFNALGHSNNYLRIRQFFSETIRLVVVSAKYSNLKAEEILQNLKTSLSGRHVHDDIKTILISISKTAIEKNNFDVLKSIQKRLSKF